MSRSIVVVWSMVVGICWALPASTQAQVGGPNIGQAIAAQARGMGQQMAAQGIALGRNMAAQGMALGQQMGAQGIALGQQMAAQGMALGRSMAAQGFGLGQQMAVQGFGIGRNFAAQGLQRGLGAVPQLPLGPGAGMRPGGGPPVQGLPVQPGGSRPQIPFGRPNR
jgi:hypothetical protein